MTNEPSFERSKPLDARYEGPSFLDPLTGLFNRYYLDQFIPQEIKKASLSNYPLSLLMIDVDKFKKINDSFGHLCGDKVLTQVAEIIKKSIRQTDTAIRYAGDEFMILLSGADKEKTAGICSNLINNIEKTVFAGDKNQKINVTLSIGYAVFPSDADEKTKLIDMADKALYLSKKRGKNRFSSAKEVTAEEVSSVVAMESFPCRKFINRQEVMDALKEAVSANIKGSALQAAFIMGPSGVGKSRILNEIAGYIKDQGIILYCNASSQRAQDPYYLFAKSIGSYIDKVGIDHPEITDILLKIPSFELSELSLIVPQLRKLVKKMSDLTSDDRGRRFLIFKAFLNLLNGLKDLLPIFVIFDDMQWADKASLELMRYLIKQEKSKNISIIGTIADASTSYAGSDDLIHNILDEFAQFANVKKFVLNNLSLSDTTMMVGAIFPGIERSKEFAALIYETTEGNPYFIEEILKWLVEKGIIFYQKDGWKVKPGIIHNDIPVSLDEIIKNRLTSLDDETKEMILQAAVIGKNFQTDILNKLGDRNEGFVSELIDRARSMHLVENMDNKGGVNFINERTQDILYSQLDEDQRKSIHYKIAQVLVDEHKDNLYDVAGEAAFHYSHVPGQEKAVKFSKQLLEKTAELFNPNEINDYLEQFAQDLLARKEKIAVELSDKTMKDAMKFILLTQGAIKKIRLYPPTSSVRLNTIKEIYLILSQIFNEVDSLVITEVEKSLIINGKRLSPTEADYTKAEDFLYIMMEHSIKTLSLKKGLREYELNSLICHLSEARKDITDTGGWAAIINRESLEHIGIDELHFISVDEYAQVGRGRKGLHDLMLMEFLLGKIDSTAINREDIIHDVEKNPQQIAQTIADIANITTEKDRNQDEAKVVADAITKIDSQIFGNKSRGPDHKKDMARVILELEPDLRHKVIRFFLSESMGEQKNVTAGIMSTLTDDFLVDMIMDKYRDNMQNPLLIKEFIDDVLVEESRKTDVLKKLEPKLLELDINNMDLSFVTGKITWEALPTDRKRDMLLGLPQDYYSEAVLNKIDDLLKELDSKNKKEDIKDAVTRFLAKTKKLNDKARKNILRRINTFLKEPFDRVEYILEKIDEEADPSILSGIFEIVKYIINDFETDKGTISGGISKNKKLNDKKAIFINRTFTQLLKRVKKEDKKAQTDEVLKSFISDISISWLIKELVYSVIDSSKYDIKDLYIVFKDGLIDTLIDLGTKKHIDLKDPFREFLARRQMAGLLTALGKGSLSRLKKICLESKEETSPSLIELIGYLQSDEMIDALAQFIHHKNPAVRTAVVQALSEVGGVKTAELLSKIVKEEQDSNIRNLANVRLQKIKKKLPPQK